MSTPSAFEPLMRASTPRERSIAWTVTIIFGVIILIPSLMGFVVKFGELMALTNDADDGGFAITPVINYLLASAWILLSAAVGGAERHVP